MAAIRHMMYNADLLEEKIPEASDICDLKSGEGIFHWIDICGSPDIAWLEKYLSHLNLHPVLFEFLVSYDNRPHIDDFDNCIFFTLKSIEYDSIGDKILHRQINLLLGKNYLVSLHPDSSSTLNAIADRLRKKTGILRLKGCDYLCFSIIDSVVEVYYDVLDEIEVKSDALEESILKQSKEFIFDEFSDIKRELIFFRKSSVPLRDALGLLVKGKSEVIDKRSFPYFVDVRENVVGIIDSIEARIDLMYSQLDIHNSILSNRMNNVMKVLTVITAIFIPLSFIAGVYGMNFKFMPELNHPYGYYMILGLMGFIFVGMLLYFWWKKWL